MRFAVDACVPAQLAEALIALGADVASGAGRPAMPDEEVLSGAVARDRVLITTDKDFGELVFRRGLSAVGVVLIRMDITSQEAADAIARRIAALAEHGRGNFSVLEADGERVRPMPS
jgi:predicted nuclease of predicted toxin-antitoxin system